MKPIQNVFRSDLTIRWHPVPVHLRIWQWSGGGFLRSPRAQAGVWASFVIVNHPGTQSLPQVPLVQRDHEVQTLPSHRSDQPFAVGIRLRRPHWRSQDSQPKRALEFLIQLRREDRIAIMNQELVTMTTRNCFAKLLQRPVCGRMSRHVVVQNAAAADLIW